MKRKKTNIFKTFVKSIQKMNLKESKTIHTKSFEEIIKGYKGNYKCQEYDSSDVKGNEVW